MEILYLLIPLSIILVLIIAWVFIWSIQSGQYDDLDGPGYRILMDDDRTDRKRLNANAPDDHAGQHDRERPADGAKEQEHPRQSE
ncbi:MAG: cbb3-type cytochrome oxidase assembly protein CcoS [Gammaproteobacteria bacterium]|nr:cbb3-type cytochrome oxidase assembly protein CcoS [Gammaproteobacteria bacterium]